MAEPIHSLSFQDNQLSWIEGIVEPEQISILQVLESDLPIPLDAENLVSQTGPIQIANHIKYLARSNNIELERVRMCVPARMGLIKKVLVDEHIPQEAFSSLVRQELAYTTETPIEELAIYLPEYERRVKELKEILAVAIRKHVHQFFKRVAEEGNFTIDYLTLNAFAVDHLYRRLFCDRIGQVLMVNFTEKGFEVIVSDERNFIHNAFVPYSRDLKSIQDIPEEKILTGFEALINDMKNLDIDESLSFSFSRIYIFGTHLQNNWLDQLEGRINQPVQLMNPLESHLMGLDVKAPNFDAYNAHRFIEPLATLLQ